MKRGDLVQMKHGDDMTRAMVTVASDNGVSLMVMFEGLFCGYIGMMPLLRDDSGVYRDLIRQQEVALEVMGHDPSPETYDADGGLLSVANTTCPDCGSTEFKMRNYSMMWHEGDIHCAKCGKFIRMFDAG